MFHFYRCWLRVDVAVLRRALFAIACVVASVGVIRADDHPGLSYLTESELTFYESQWKPIVDKATAAKPKARLVGEIESIASWLAENVKIEKESSIEPLSIQVASFQPRPVPRERDTQTCNVEQVKLSNGRESLFVWIRSDSTGNTPLIEVDGLVRVSDGKTPHQQVYRIQRVFEQQKGTWKERARLVQLVTPD